MGSSALGADPFLWALLAALSGGLAAGQALRAFLPLGGEQEFLLRKRPARLSRSIALFAAALLAVSALLIFADKASLASELATAALILWTCVAAAIGFLAGFRPLAIGLPILGLFLLALGFLALCLQGWLPFRAAASEGFEVAHLLPYSADPSGFHGQLELPERDSVPVAQDLALSTNAVCLRVECLAYSGPLRLAASIVAPGEAPPGGASPGVDPFALGEGAITAFSPVLRFYRVVGMASPDGRASLSFAKPRHAGFLDAVLGLGAARSASTFFGLAVRSARSSPPARLLALEPVTFFLAADGSQLWLGAEK